MIDLRFPTALQMLLLLTVAEKSGTPNVSSAQMAQGLGVQASLVRKLIGPLGQSGLVVSARGKSGGVRLVRPASEITLQEIYRAVVQDKKIWEARWGGPRSCLVSTHTAPFFEALTGDAEQAVMNVLGGRTLAQSLAELEILDAAMHKKHTALAED